jgi:hypothetical protein
VEIRRKIQKQKGNMIEKGMNSKGEVVCNTESGLAMDLCNRSDMISAGFLSNRVHGKLYRERNSENGF